MPELEDPVSEQPTVAQRDLPLTGTLRFVFVMGAAFLVGWFAMFMLLKERW
jgi:hypothetical protein